MATQDNQAICAGLNREFSMALSALVNGSLRNGVGADYMVLELELSKLHCANVYFAQAQRAQIEEMKKKIISPETNLIK